MSTSPAPQARRKLSTGVFPVSSVRGILLPEQLACAAQEFVEQNTAAVLLLPTCATPARSAVAAGTQLELAMTNPLMDWLAEHRQTGVVSVPQNLRRVLRSFRVMTLSVATPVLHLGTLVVPAPVNLQETTRVLEGLTTDFALRLEAWQRAELLLHFAETESTFGDPSSGLRPKVTALPTSRRSA